MTQNPFVPLENGVWEDLISHCCVCRLPRLAIALNDHGYCQSCWEYIPGRFRTASSRAVERQRMAWLIADAAKGAKRRLRVPNLYWNEEQNTWLWSLKKAIYVADKKGKLTKLHEVTKLPA